jgi:hypothetical protein
MRNVQRVTLKFKGQRKAREYVVYPKGYRSDGTLVFQADDACGIVDPTTRRCLYTAKSSYPVMLAAPGAIKFVMEQADLDAIIAAQPQSGDKIGAGVFIA